MAWLRNIECLTFFLFFEAILWGELTKSLWCSWGLQILLGTLLVRPGEGSLEVVWWTIFFCSLSEGMLKTKIRGE